MRQCILVEIPLPSVVVKNQVWYEIKAFSRPRYWAARLAFPIARYFQRKFVVESLANMKKVMHENL